MMADEMDLKDIWNKVSDVVKQKVIHPTLWRTLELAVPITIDGNQFILGFSQRDFNMAGHLTTADHRNAIESALREFAGRQLTIRIIDGTTMADWKHVLEKEQSMWNMQQAADKKREAEATYTRSWESLYEQVGRAYANTPFRQFPQARAEYIENMVKEVSTAIDEMMPPGKTNELAERSLARVLDRIGSLTETPGAVIALEVKRYRASKK